jgi:hydrogenase-1 operon protein HyaF
MHAFPVPVVALGPGSRQEDETLDYLPLPHDMRTYRPPILPEPEELGKQADVGVWLEQLLQAVQNWGILRSTVSLDMSSLSDASRTLIDQVLGEGEVSARIASEAGTLTIQESVFAGVWRVRGRDSAGHAFADRVEVGDVPVAVRRAMDSGLPAPVYSPPGPGVANAPALLAEIAEQLAHSTAPAHVINLSLLPFTPEDGAWLDQCLGRGQVTLLSRGYGNCRITATGIARVWWVQYFNSQDALILNTLEVSDVPEVACAADVDLEDSADRLAEVLEWIG